MNNTIICSLSDLMRYSFLQEFSKNIFFICVLDVLVFLAASIGNTLTLVALRRSQSIHPPSKALFCSLALSDLCVGLVVVPLHFGLMLATIVEVPSLYCALAGITHDCDRFCYGVGFPHDHYRNCCGQISRFLP